MTARFSTDPVAVPGIVSIKATETSAPPTWAIMERRLIEAMGEAAAMMVRKYTEPGGALYFADDLDDLYERFFNWGLCYAIGADEKLLDLALQQWNATTRFSDDSIVSRVHPRFRPQVHNEYYNLAQPGGAEWHHKSEGNMAFYDFGVACPSISENVRRAKRFAAMYIGEDPETSNYDPEHKVFRSPIQSSQGPYLSATVDHVKDWLDPVYQGQPAEYAQRATLHPIVRDLEPDWHEDPQRSQEIVKLFDEIVLNGDVPNSLGATALVTNAYLYTGEEKYRRWVLEYTDAWMDRMRLNDGIMPDNVGPTGEIGERREGQWWGGLYGWNSRFSADIMFHSLTVAAECALLLTGDYGYIELLRSQVELLMSHAITREDGQLLVPTRYGPNGWEAFQPMRIRELAHLYHASMDPQDHDLIDRLRSGDKERDWNDVMSEPDGRSGVSEYARFQYYDGLNPDWPEKVLSAEYQYVVTAIEEMKRDKRDVETIIADNLCPPNPVVTKGLTQVTLGAPKTVYNGGLLCARVRYFDPDRSRPGLPLDVAALVDKLEADGAGIQLVNLSTTEARNLIVQAGAFGEHQFTDLRIQATGDDAPRTVEVDSKYFAVRLPPSTSIRVDVGMRRFVHRPSYAFPWHVDGIPVPFQ